jgi:hypothetical protein
MAAVRTGRIARKKECEKYISVGFRKEGKRTEGP